MTMNGRMAMCVEVATLAVKISDAVSSRCAALRVRADSIG